MPHDLRRSVSLLAILALAACASAKPVATAINPTPPEPAEVPTVPPSPVESGPGNGFAGIWYVSGVFPTAMTEASVADPHLGTALTIASTEVSDINGQRCISPVFESDRIDAAATGLKAATAGNWDRLVVSCDGKAFATYLRLPDQPGAHAALLQQRSEGLYLLEPASAVLHRQPGETTQPAQMDAVGATAHDTAPPAPKEATAETHGAAAAPVELTTPAAPAPVPEGPVADVQAEPVAKASAPDGSKLPAAGSAIHLASYKGESAAKRGWKILLGEYDELDPLSPLYVAVDVPGKGVIIRLYASGASEADLAKICAALKAKKVYCALNP
jgi:hypothetical protein